MKILNIKLVLILCACFLFSCVEKEEFFPELEGIPGGGLLDAEVKSVSGSKVVFRLDLFAVNHYGDFIENLDGNCLATDDDFPKADLISIGKGTNDEKGAYSAAMLFDQSGSILENDPLDARVAAGKAFVDIMNTDDEVAVAAFADGGFFPGNPTMLEEFSNDKVQLRTVIDDLADKEDGGTPLYVSINNLVDYVNDAAKNSNKAVIVMTDGQDTEGGVNIGNLIDKAVINGVEVYTIGLGFDVDLDILQEIALQTGGAVMQAQDALQLISLYNSLADLLRGEGVFYETCWELEKPGGLDWFSGEIIVTVIELTLPTGEIIEYPVRLAIP